MRFINRRPERGERWLLALLPFILLALVYVVASSARLADNPDDRLLPSVAQCSTPSRGWPSPRTHAPAPCCSGPIRWPA